MDRVSKDQFSKKVDVVWKKKKRYIWIIGGVIIVILIAYYVVARNEQIIGLISFIAGISSIVLACSAIIISKNYNEFTGEMLERIELSVETVTDELQHRLYDLEDMKKTLENLPSSMPEKKELLDKIETMEEVIITSPLLASERSHHDDKEIRNYERKIRDGQRKLYQYNKDLKETSSEKERTKIQEKKNNVEEKIKSADEQMKKIMNK